MARVSLGNRRAAQEILCVAGRNGDGAWGRQHGGSSANLSPSGIAAENSEPQQVEAIDHEDAAGPGVADPEFGLRGVGRAEGELEGEEPGGNEKRNDEKTLVCVVP